MIHIPTVLNRLSYSKTSISLALQFTPSRIPNSGGLPCLKCLSSRSWPQPCRLQREQPQHPRCPSQEPGMYSPHPPSFQSVSQTTSEVVFSTYKSSLTRTILMLERGGIRDIRKCSSSLNKERGFLVVVQEAARFRLEELAVFFAGWWRRRAGELCLVLLALFYMCRGAKDGEDFEQCTKYP